MADEKRFFTSQVHAIKQYIDKTSPVSTKQLSTVFAVLGFRWLPKFLYNRLASEKDPMAFADWTGIWVTSATGLIALSYGGGLGFRYWLFVEGVGNTIGTVFYSF